MIPIPGADIAALVVNTWTMYVRINKVVGVSFGDHVLKSIVSGVIANIISTLPALGLGLVTQGILKFVPGIGTLGGAALGAVVNVGVMYAAGKVYLKALEKLLNSGEPLTADNLGEEARRVSKEKSFVKEVYDEGKEIGKKNR